MANVLVHIELVDSAPSARSLAALNAGRRVATRLGATLHAVVARPTRRAVDEPATVARLSAHGADKIVWVTRPSCAETALSATHGKALLSAHARFPAQLILLPGGPGSRDIGPRLSLELGGRYGGDARLHDSDGSLEYTCRAHRRKYVTGDEIRAAPRPLILSLAGPVDAAAGVGSGEAEVVDLEPTGADGSPFEAITTAVDGNGAARLTLCAGGGLSNPQSPRARAAPQSGSFSLLRDLARAMKAELVASTTACERGIAPADLRVGLDGRAVESDVYVTFAVSGSERHLAAIAPGTTLIAINSDPAAPIFAVADYGLVADAAEVIEHLVRRFADAQKE